MILTRNKVEPRNSNRPSLEKFALKSKTSLPQTSSSAMAVFEQMKLTLSQEIQDFHSNEFQFNIIPPFLSIVEHEPMTKKFSCPEWILLSHMNSSYQKKQSNAKSENPQTFQENLQNSQQEKENSAELSKKTDSQNENDLLKVEKSEIQRILQMTVSDDKERQINETDLNFNIRICEDLESRSTFLSKFHCKELQNMNLTTFDLPKKVSLISPSAKPKSANIRHSQNLENFYRIEMEIFSEYGLKPSEKNRLKKIQELEKMQLLQEQTDNIMANDAEQNQEYFSGINNKKTTGEMNKMRKCSAIVEVGGNQRKECPKRSLSKGKYSLSKRKKVSAKNLAAKRQ